MTNPAELREFVRAQNARLPVEGLVRLTWGNVSGRAGDLIAIKPSGVPYQDLRVDDIVVLDLEGRIVAGELRPSIDTPTHLHLYREFPEIGGVVHAHSTYGTAFAQARTPLPCLGTTHADHFHGPVPVTRPLTAEEVGDGYEANTGRVIVEHFVGNAIEPMHVPGVLVAGHAPFVWGEDASTAVDNAVALEASAKMTVITGSLTSEQPQQLEEWVLAKHHLRKHGADAYYGQGKQ